MDRKLNALFLFLLVVVFISAASVTQQWNVILGLILSAGFSFAAFSLCRLTLDGMFAAIVTGTFVFGFGGWAATAVVLLFFITSAIISNQWKIQSADSPDDVRRDGLQVWANGFWLLVCLVLAVIFNLPIFIIGAMAVVATAAADTWATELGSTAPDATYLITSFETVTAGTDGAVSLRGTTAAIAASAMIAAVSVYVFSLSLSILLCIFIAGFLGCLVDSYLGATFQRNNRSVTIPVLQSTVSIDNNLVNGISTGAGALLAITLSLLIA